ncbi:MAG: molybdate ABC transporter permease subunit [Alphaproteobacteria bacterium]|nr:molybdate ABC transporter permease subunit [Alphaproteobacteria bacterium]MBF0249406.1 molybdate ABC transporter permease subunit [Alphaproteobacteria bacterium]
MIDMAPFTLSIQLAAVTLAVLLIIGTPLAWWLAMTRTPFKPVVETVTALPLVLPPTVLGFYLLVFLGPQGWAGGMWNAFFGRPLTFTFAGLVVASCVYSLPFVVQPLQGAFERLDRRTVEAALTLGASWPRTFVQVVLPQVRHGLLTASVLGFAHTIGEFGVVLMVGGNIPGETQVLSIAIYEHVEALDYAAAGTLSSILVAASFVGLLPLYSQARKRRKWREVSA